MNNAPPPADVSLSVKEEIRRFESVHPCIYALYDMLDTLECRDDLTETVLQMREQIVCIEDSFVNSQEWTLGRQVPQLKLGVIGDMASGKSALVHRYLTGQYMNEESPEGGRFKKEVIIDGRSYLLLIRDEGGVPDRQLCQWCDAIIMVFSLADINSAEILRQFANHVAQYRNRHDLPIVLVGAADSTSGSNHRPIDSVDVRSLTTELRAQSYYETCATYGLNVEQVFRDACQRMLRGGQHDGHTQMHQSISPRPHSVQTPIRASEHVICRQSSTTPMLSVGETWQPGERQTIIPVDAPPVTHSTPHATPNQNRKNRRISNIFQRVGNKEEKEAKNGHHHSHSHGNPNSLIGKGRDIPVKQGLLYKRSSKTLNKEWKKKYVCVYETGRLVYHNSVKEYMENSLSSNNKCKQVYLPLCSVKLPKQRRPRHPADTSSQSTPHSNAELDSTLLNGTDVTVDLAACSSDDCTSSARLSKIGGNFEKPEKPSKHHHRKRGDKGEEEECEFVILTNDGRAWQFEAINVEERDSWVKCIEEQIAQGLQAQSSMSKARPTGDQALIGKLGELAGNDVCVDCSAPKPVWASLNHGSLMCIVCSGVHRQLGTHVSRVRSLLLDEWPTEYINIMQSLGNAWLNHVLEFDLHGDAKPGEGSTRESKETYIRAKYVNRKYMAPVQMFTASSSPNQSPLSPSQSNPISSRIVDAVLKGDLRSLALSLLYSDEPHVNVTLSVRDRRTPLHLACSNDAPAIAQMLLWHGADMRLCDEGGRSALFYASQGGSSACQMLLVQAGLEDDYGIPSSNAPSSPHIHSSLI